MHSRPSIAWPQPLLDMRNNSLQGLVTCHSHMAKCRTFGIALRILTQSLSIHPCHTGSWLTPKATPHFPASRDMYLLSGFCQSLVPPTLRNHPCSKSALSLFSEKPWPICLSRSSCQPAWQPWCSCLVLLRHPGTSCLTLLCTVQGFIE